MRKIAPFVALFILFSLSLPSQAVSNLNTFVKRTNSAAFDPDDFFTINLGVNNAPTSAGTDAQAIFGHYKIPPELEFVNSNDCPCNKSPNIDQVSCLLYILKGGSLSAITDLALGHFPVFKFKNPIAFCQGKTGEEVVNLGKFTVKPLSQFEAGTGADIDLKVNCTVADGNGDTSLGDNGGGDNGGNNDNNTPPPSTNAYFWLTNGSFLHRQNDGDYIGFLKYSISITNKPEDPGPPELPAVNPRVFIGKFVYGLTGHSAGSVLSQKVTFNGTTSDEGCISTGNSVICDFDFIESGANKTLNFTLDIKDASKEGINPGFKPTIPCADVIISDSSAAFHNYSVQHPSNLNTVFEIGGFFDASSSFSRLGMNLDTSGVTGLDCDSQTLRNADGDFIGNYGGNNTTVAPAPDLDVFFRIEKADIDLDTEGRYSGHLDYEISFTNTEDIALTFKEVAYRFSKLGFNEGLSNPSCRGDGSLVACDFQAINPDATVSRKFRLDIDKFDGFIPTSLCTNRTAGPENVADYHNITGLSLHQFVDELSGINVFQESSILRLHTYSIDLDLSQVNGLDCDAGTYTHPGN